MALPEVANVVGQYLRRSNINTQYLPYFDKIQDFLRWYKGKTQWHTYYQHNGFKKVRREKMSLNFAKRVSEDFASLIMNEKLNIKCSDPLSQDLIDKVLEGNKFRVNASQLVELMFALGTGSFVATWDGTGVVIDYIHGDLIFPLNWSNGKITECAFATIGGDNKDTAYTVLSYKLNEDGTYRVEKAQVDVDGNIVRPGQLSSALKSDDTYIEIWDTGSRNAPFQIIKTNIVNNFDKTSPLGMSIYGNALDLMKSLDEAFDSLYNEFALGKKRIFIKSGLRAIKFDNKEDFDGSWYSQVDVNDVAFYQIDWAGEHEDKTPIYESNMQLRMQEHEQGINMILKMLSQCCGLGDNFYEFSGTGIARTATEVVSVHSALFRNVQKQELVIADAVKGLCRTILEMYNLYTGTAFDINQEITVDFDDSIIQDSEKERQNAMNEYNAGLIDQVEYFVLTRGYTREQAIEFVNQMKMTDTLKETPEILSSIGGGII